MSPPQEPQSTRKNPLEDANVARAFVKTAAQISRSLNESNGGMFLLDVSGCDISTVVVFGSFFVEQ